MKDGARPRIDPPPGAAGLGVVATLLERLHAAGIAYCHWKSNEHLAPALEGLTDLDVLVDPRQHLALQAVLADCGYKRFAAAGSKGYPAVEDYLGFDQATGRVSHLHLHYRLTVGQPHLKGYRLPWERRVLETRTFDAVHGVCLADPAMEMLLLLTRRVLKQRLRDHLRQVLGRRRGSPDFRREFDWLRDRIDPTALLQLGRELLGPDVEAPIIRLLEAPDDPAARRAFARAARPRLDLFRTYGRLSSGLRAALREGQWLLDGLNRRLLHRPVPLRRVSPRGGVVIVLLGSDGSGKSSILKELVSWLGAKLDVMPIYFGSGQGRGSLYRLPLQVLRGMVERISPPPPTRTDAATRRSASEGRGLIRSIGLLPWALTLSLEKRAKLRRLTRARNRGMIVICDRFPQAEIPGFNDGALLTHLRASRWAVCRALAAWEAVPYRQWALDPPDLVLKLSARPEVIATRRPEMTMPQIHRRLDAIEALRFPGVEAVLDIRTDGPLDQTVLAVKCQVWERL